jgi:DNA polymerase-3 subunit chi
VTEVGFYHLTRWSLERALPPLLEKALAAGHRIVLLAPSTERAEDLAQHLWTFEPGSWLPHGTARDGHAELQPVYLTAVEEAPNGADVLVGVEGVQAGFADRFARVLDMFNGRDEAAVAAARDRWRAYRERGFALTYWQQTDAGGWQKQG